MYSSFDKEFTLFRVTVQSLKGNTSGIPIMKSSQLKRNKCYRTSVYTGIYLVAAPVSDVQAHVRQGEAGRREAAMDGRSDVLP